MPAGTRIGVLGHGTLATVDQHGALAGDEGAPALEWWIGADDRWHLPAEEPSTRQRRRAPAPVIETSLRIPGGDAVHRAYGATSDDSAVAVVEIENQSPAPFTLALVVRFPRAATVELDGTTVRVDGEVALALPRPPGAWAAGESTREIVTTGAARLDAFESVRAPVELALLFPVAHRTTWRAALSSSALDVRALPGAEAVTRGWDRQLERGLQAELPAPLGAGVDPARADLLLADRGDPAVVAALEDWGNDSEAADAWVRLGSRARRRARRRDVPGDPWAAALGSDRADPAGFLSRVRAVLARERSGAVDLLPGFPPEWLGQSVTVDGLPLRAGTLSFAVRWHGARPALLWDAPAGVELRVPVLDPAWSSKEPAGEELLAEPSATLLPMGVRDRSAGSPVAAPGQFS